MIRIADNCDYDALVYVLSHDLRAPARALRQYVILLTEELTGELSEPAERFMSRLGQVLDRLDGRLDAILTLSRFGRRRGEPKVIDLGQVMRDALGARDMVGTVSPTLPEVCADPTRAHWLIGELADNVRHHAGEDARLTFDFQDGRFEVRDDGNGIAERIHDEVFMVFRPVQHSDSGRAGMGLACVSRIVRSLGGTVGIELPDSGGTCVHFTLPLASEVVDPDVDDGSPSG